MILRIQRNALATTNIVHGPKRRERGQIMILFAFGVVAITACVGLAVDVGMLMTTRRSYQKIADTCATVGAQSAVAATRALSCLATNNIATGAAVSVPPTAGAYQGNNQYVEVKINRDAPTMFMRALGVGTVPIGVRAVAHSTQDLDFGIMGLQPGIEAVKSAGTSNSQVNGNACSAGDFKVSGNLDIRGYAVANGSFNGSPTSYGMWSGPSSQACEDPGYPLPTPLPVAMPLPLPGPALDIKPPAYCNTASGTVNVPAAASVTIQCPVGWTVRVSAPRASVDIKSSNNATVELLPSGSPSNATFQDVRIQGSGPVTLAPGWYDTVRTGSSNTDITFSPGLYLINSSYDQSTGGNLTGSGVSIVVGHQLEKTGGGNVTLTCCAPEMQNNILIYHTGARLPGSPWNVGPDPNEINISGNNSTITLTGNIYSPLGSPPSDFCDDPCVQVGGNSTTMTITGQIAARTVEVNGTGLTMTFNGTGGSGPRRPRLVE